MNMLLIILIEIAIVFLYKYFIQPKIFISTDSISNVDNSKKKILFILLSIAYLSFAFSYVFKRDINEIFDFAFIILIVQVVIIVLLSEIIFRKYVFNICMKFTKDFNIAGYLQAVLYAICATVFFVSIFTLENYSIPFMFGMFLVLGKLLQVMYYHYLNSNTRNLILLNLVSIIIAVTISYIL